MGGQLVLGLQHGLLAGHGDDGTAVLPGGGDAAGDDVLGHHGPYGVVDQHDVLRAVDLLQPEHAVADGALAVRAAGEDVLQLGDAVLPGVGAEDRLPALHADHRDGVDVRMLLKGLQRVGDHGLVVHGQELLGNLLPHAHAAPAGDNQCNVHDARSLHW